MERRIGEESGFSEKLTELEKNLSEGYIIEMGLLPIEWVILVDYRSAHVFSGNRRGLARAQGVSPVHGRT